MSTRPPAPAQPELRFPERVRPYPRPPGEAEALTRGSTPIRQVFTAANEQKVLRGGPVLVCGFLVRSATAAVVAYILDTNTELAVPSIPDARKGLAATAAAGAMDGWLAPNVEMAPRMFKGLAVIADVADAEVFVFIKD